MVFSSLRVKNRHDSLARRNSRRVVGARAQLTMPAMRAKKKPAGVDHPTGFIYCLKDGPPGARGPGGSTRTTPRSRGTALRWQRVRRKEFLGRGSCPNLQRSRQKTNKKPGGLRPTGSCETQEAEPPGVKALRKQFGAKRAQRNRRDCAGHQCVLRGQELLHGSLVRLVVGRSVMVDLWGVGG